MNRLYQMPLETGRHGPLTKEAVFYTLIVRKGVRMAQQTSNLRNLVTARFFQVIEEKAARARFVRLGPLVQMTNQSNDAREQIGPYRRVSTQCFCPSGDTCAVVGFLHFVEQAGLDGAWATHYRFELRANLFWPFEGDELRARLFDLWNLRGRSIEQTALGVALQNVEDHKKIFQAYAIFKCNGDNRRATDGFCELLSDTRRNGGCVQGPFSFLQANGLVPTGYLLGCERAFWQRFGETTLHAIANRWIPATF